MFSCARITDNARIKCVLILAVNVLKIIKIINLKHKDSFYNIKKKTFALLILFDVKEDCKKQFDEFVLLIDLIIEKCELKFLFTVLEKTPSSSVVSGRFTIFKLFYKNKNFNI